MFNGVTDGSAIMYGIYTYCGFYGSDIFLYSVSWTLGSELMTFTIGEIIVLIIVSSQSLAIMANLYTIIGH